METRTWSYTNAFGQEQEVMEFRIKNGDGSNRYVEVHALLNAFAESTLNFLEVEEIIKSVPKSDVAPVVHGEWVKDEEESKGHIESIYICSACHNFSAWGETEKYNYCPNCGARMDGGSEKNAK